MSNFIGFLKNVSLNNHFFFKKSVFFYCLKDNYKVRVNSDCLIIDTVPHNSISFHYCPISLVSSHKGKKERKKMNFCVYFLLWWSSSHRNSIPIKFFSYSMCLLLPIHHYELYGKPFLILLSHNVSNIDSWSFSLPLKVLILSVPRNTETLAYLSLFSTLMLLNPLSLSSCRSFSRNQCIDS